MSAIEVVEAGIFTSVQDAVGRPGWRHLGVPAGGAADSWSARLANRLVGNPDGAALLEITLRGPTLRFLTAGAFALVGSFEATVDGLPVDAGVAREVRAGGLLRLGAGRDARGFVALAGGVVVPSVLGSSSTDLRAGFGGLEGRALRIGDALTLGADRGGRFRWAGSAPPGPIRILPGPDADHLAAGELAGRAWRVGTEADRTGVRLDGEPLSRAGGEIASVGLPAGAIQVPPDGRPIVMLADRPVTGGYPVPAVVIGADIGRVARLRPGGEVRFVLVSFREALEARRAMEASIADLETLGPDADDELGWAGSHG